MHAASVYPEPGSNSPKMHDLSAVTCSEGLTARTALSRISGHSSRVKVQRPRHDGPRRADPQVWGLTLDQSNLNDLPGPKTRSRLPPVEAARRRILRAGSRGCQTGPVAEPSA